MNQKWDKSKGCPRHGTEHLKDEGSFIYCIAPTPGELADICLYHLPGRWIRKPSKPLIYVCKYCGEPAGKSGMCPVHFNHYQSLHRLLRAGKIGKEEIKKRLALC